MKTPRCGNFWGGDVGHGVVDKDPNVTATGSEFHKQETRHSSVVLPGLKQQPRIPTFGPASQLSPQVLISSVASHNQHGTSPGRSHAKGAVTLPSLQLRQGMMSNFKDGGPPAPASARVRSNVGASWEPASNLHGGSAHARKAQSCGPRLHMPSASSPREPEMHSQGLRSKLYKGDHTFRLQAYPPDGGESRAREDAGTGAPISSNSPRGPYAQEESDLVSSSSPVHINGLPTEGPLTTPMLQKMEKPTTPREGEVRAMKEERCSSIQSSVSGLGGRSASIRACFQLEERDIEAALTRMHRYQSFHEIEIKSETKIPEVSALHALYESCGISSKSEREAYLRRDEDRPADGSDHADMASSTEISTCTAVLNFYRWLCGLPLVRLNAGRLTVCNIISDVLLPRANPQQPLGADSSEFMEALTNIIGCNENRVSVLQGEASLLSAVEQSLSSTHTLSSNAVEMGYDPPEHASALAEQVGLINPGAVEARVPEKYRQQKVCGRAASYCHHLQPITMVRELPFPLKPLRVFWDLQAGLGLRLAHVRIQSKVTVKSEKSSQPAQPKARTGDHSASLSAIWGDRNGALAFRRCLLSPSLREFGAARRHDTCVLWTGHAKVLEDPLQLCGSPTSRRTSKEVDYYHKPRKNIKAPKTADQHGDAADEKGGNPKEAAPRRRTKSLLMLPTGQEVGNTNEELRGSGTPRGKPRQPSKDGSISGRRPDVGVLGAVCWPPSGLVPISIVMNRRVAWTIMPDGSRFQPTESTQIRVWKVKMERPASGHFTAERVAEVAIKGFAVDCSSVGQPFCVIFWPDFGIAVDGCQLEVELSGLRGDCTKLNFFYEFRNFFQAILNECLCAEAATLRSVIGDHVFWSEPRVPDLQVQLAVDASTDKSKQARTRTTLKREPDKAPIIKLISYQEMSFTTHCVDVTIVVQSDEVAAMQVELNLVRFSGEEEEVPHGAVAQKLPQGNYFFIRAKLPLSRQRFDIRFYTSTVNYPDEFKIHPLRYLITASKECQSLLSTLDDPRKKKFGYCDLQPSGQRNGIIVIAPALRRITIGSCYFLVYVDKQVALAAAKAELEEALKSAADDGYEVGRRGVRASTMAMSAGSFRETDQQTRGARLYKQRLQLPEMSEANLCKTALAARSGEQRSADEIEGDELTPASTPAGGSGGTSRRRKTEVLGNQKTEYLGALAAADAHRSSLKRHSYKRVGTKAAIASGERYESDGQTATVSRIQTNLRAVLEKNTQDAGEEIALEVSLRNGEVIYRLREREDFPGLYEGLFSFEDRDFEKTVQLYYRFPIAHSVEYAPRKLGEWFVVRDEQLPQNF